MSVKDLLDAGVHYGHRTSRWHPSMSPYIYGKRKGIHIIDLRQTVRGIAKARRLLSQMAAQGLPILIVGTKRQAASVVREEAANHGIAFVAERWLGGTLTNFQTIRKSLGRLDELEKLEASSQFASYKKKMISIHMREKRKILRNLEGIRDLTSVPAALVVVDPKRDKIAVHEANTLGIPVVALIDTDSDPKDISICIPCNDDSIRSVQIVLSLLIEAVADGQNLAAAVAQDKAAGAPQRKPEPKHPTTPAPPPQPPPAPPADKGAADAPAVS